MLERVVDLSMTARLLGLFSTDLLANDMSAITRVMETLPTQGATGHIKPRSHELKRGTHLPSNLCFRKSNSAFCIMSVTCRDGRCWCVCVCQVLPGTSV